MKIYAVRDRLLDYYMTPFVAPNDNEVKGALARTVNNQEDTNGIAQAPHHFELWELGIVEEDGHITKTRIFVCDCSSLIRTGVRTRAEREGQEAANAAGAHPALNRGNGPPGGALNGSLPHQAQAAQEATGEVRRGPQGGYPPRTDG